MAELEAMQQKETLYIQLQMKPDASIRFYTGFPSFKVLAATFDTLRPTAEKMHSWSQMQRLRNRGTMVVDTYLTSFTYFLPNYDWELLTRS